MQQTLVFLKPDCLQRGLIGEIISRFEKRGLKIVAMKMLKITPELSKKHYAHLVTKGFYPDLEKFVTSYPVVAFVLEGKEVIEVLRGMLGPTNSRKAPSGTIRGDFSMSMSRNIIHASDSLEAAQKEIDNFFKKEEMYSYEFLNDEFIYASDE
ncbi:MAG: nucleoside-diphosphate kinase [Candidatus Micrarchaeota archaeon]